MEQNVFEFAIAFGKAILTTCLGWFVKIYEATGMTNLWIGVVVLAIVFSLILAPLRGGSDITTGTFSNFLSNQINKHKSREKN